MRRPLLPLLACLAVAGPATAQPATPAPDAQAPSPEREARIDALSTRGIAALATLPAAERKSLAYRLAANLLQLGRCSAAESLSQSQQLVAVGVDFYLKPAALRSDRACADRFITRYAEAPREGQAGPDFWRLYTAGRLWRVIGQRDKADAAIETAERHYVQEEERDPTDAWSCHGGNCVSRLWVVRLHTLTYLEGTYDYRPELRWLATQALSYAHAREANHPAPLVSQTLMSQLLDLTVALGKDRLAQLLAEETVYRFPAAYAGARMRWLIERGRIEEALELWPTAGRGFLSTITPAQLRAKLPLFHRWREQLKTLLWRQPGALLSLLAAIWIERRQPDRAREALATARAAYAEVRGYDWDLEDVQRLLAVEAMLDGGADPIGWLSRHPGLTQRSFERDYAFADLAALLAATGREAEARRALAELHDPRVRQARLVELPCRAADGGNSAAVFAVDLARANLRFRDHGETDEADTFRGRILQTFRCLMQTGRGAAALAYADAVPDADQRLSLYIGDSTTMGDVALQRRFAERAYALVAARNLWADRLVAYLAARFERIGDFAAVDRVLARVRGELVIDTYDQLLGVYVRPPA